MARRRQLTATWKGPLRSKREKRAFTPFAAPPKPPVGFYDPNLDAQERASKRGLLDLTQDTERDNSRAYSDLRLQAGNITQSRDEGLADLLRRRQEIGQSYQRQAIGQTDAARAAGVSRGGALLQALAKRTKNQQFDLQPVATAENRTRADADRRLGALGTDYQRGAEDRNTTLTRARREGGFFSQDIGAQRHYQAKAAGYVGPAAPKNEFTRNGLTFHLSGQGPKRKYTLPTGQVLNRKSYVQLVRRRKARGNPGVLYG